MFCPVKERAAVAIEFIEVYTNPSILWAVELPLIIKLPNLLTDDWINTFEIENMEMLMPVLYCDKEKTDFTKEIIDFFNKDKW